MHSAKRSETAEVPRKGYLCTLINEKTSVILDEGQFKSVV